jgi:hypothetical protein
VDKIEQFDGFNDETPEAFEPEINPWDILNDLAARVTKLEEQLKRHIG